MSETNYTSGEDYVVEFLGYRFGFNGDDFEQRITAAAVRLGAINAQVTDANLRAKGTAVINAVEGAVLHRRFIGSKYANVKGITITGITRPVEKTADWTYYHSLDFALQTGWDEFEDLLAS